MNHRPLRAESGLRSVPGADRGPVVPGESQSPQASPGASTPDWWTDRLVLTSNDLEKAGFPPSFVTAIMAAHGIPHADGGRSRLVVFRADVERWLDARRIARFRHGRHG